MAIISAAKAKKTVADPVESYNEIVNLWQKSRAVCKGERFVKQYDRLLDVSTYTNMLIPFSPSMSQQQYDFYKAEAELPGIVAQFAKMLVGGLLRKQPILELPDGVPEEAHNWIIEEFGQDGSSLASFLDTALWEEMQTSRAWVYVDYPVVESDVTPEQAKFLKPYPLLLQPETIINWRMSTDEIGKRKLNMLIIKGTTEDFTEDEFHPTDVETLWVHELDEAGFYQIRVFKKNTQQAAKSNLPGGTSTASTEYANTETITNILDRGERLTDIPAWPLNGSYEIVEPMLMAIIDREIGLYNKLSRRNHLLYGASTYTPIISSDMSDEDFQNIVASGLGTWIKLRSGDTATVLETPTAALADMENAIAATLVEMAKMGIRMLTPETAQSGVALDIRNAAQTAQLGTLNNKCSNTLTSIICFMINWRYGLDLSPADIQFSLSADFNPTPLGADWLRLVTEWYQQGFIPRSVWLQILKLNDIIPPDYDDDDGIKEINDDELIVTKTAEMDYSNKIVDEK